MLRKWWRKPFLGWLSLLLAPLVVWGAVGQSESLRSRVQAETREEALYLGLADAFSAEASVESVLARHPAVLQDMRPLLSSATQDVSSRVVLVERNGTGDDRRAVLVNALPRRVLSYHVDAARWVSLVASGRLAAARRLYGGRMRRERQELSAFIGVQAIKQHQDVEEANEDAFIGNLVGYGGAGLLMIGLIVRLALVLRAAARRTSAKRIGHARMQYQRIVETAQEGVWTVDTEARTTLVNSSMARMLGMNPEEMIGRTVFEFMDAEQASVTKRDFERLQRRLSLKREVRMRTSDGREIWVMASAAPMLDPDGSYVGALAMISDITATKRLETHLRHLAEHDPLTGVFNRRRLIQELEHQLAGGSDLPLFGAVITLDLDNFKVANDTSGHAAGDAMLKAVAERLQVRARKADLVARLGGDEFTIMLPGETVEDAQVVAQDLRGLLCERPIGPPIMASFGIAGYSVETNLTADEVLVCADMAVYEAKEHGGDQVQVYRGQASGALKWVQKIRDALAEDRFVLYGQPIVDIRSSKVTSHELLIRMLSDDGDVIPPASFLPTAERFGLIRQIDLWVTTAGLQIAKNRKPVCINLSAHSIGEQPVLDAVSQAIGEGLDPRNVMFEITETAAFTNLSAARRFAEALQKLGCKLALDDFGTGFGSFTYLKYIPADYLKIDMEFVRELKANGADQQIVKSIIGVAHSLEKETIAEGVEDAETLAILKALGVHRAQGYHLGAPKRMSPPTEHERRLQRARAHRAPRRRTGKRNIPLTPR